MFKNGQFVLCINDWFPACAAEWGNQLPEAGLIYRIKAVKHCPDVRSNALGYGLVLDELNNPGDCLAFSTWRFLPVHGEGNPAVPATDLGVQDN